jgi:hypothetical protein
MEVDAMLLRFARRLPSSRPGPLRQGRNGSVTPHPVPAVPLKIEAADEVWKSVSQG